MDRNGSLVPEVVVVMNVSIVDGTVDGEVCLMSIPQSSPYGAA